MIQVNIIQLDPRINNVILKVLKENLFLQPGEKFLLVADYPSILDLKYRESKIIQRIFERDIMLKRIKQIAQNYFPEIQTDMFLFQCPWMHYPDKVEGLEEKLSEYDVALILTEFSITNLIIMLISDDKSNIRIATAPTCDQSIFLPEGPLDISDNTALEKRVMLSYSKFKKAKTLRIWNHFGTDITISLGKAKFRYETGIIDYPKKMTNLPGGEVSIFNIKDINGKFVVPAGWIEGLNGNLVLEIKQNKLVNINQDNVDKKWLKQNYFLEKKQFNISSISIGHNERASNPFTPLELMKMIGVVNLRITMNINKNSLPGTISFPGHFPSPNIYLEADGEMIFKNGQYLLA